MATLTETKTTTSTVPVENVFGQVIGYRLAEYLGEGTMMNAGHSTGYDWEYDDYDMPVGFRG